jgi:hypothetical protein
MIKKQTTVRTIGRPRIAESKKRKVYVCINCTESELKMIDRKAKEYNLRRSALVRMAIEKI